MEELVELEEAQTLFIREKPVEEGTNLWPKIQVGLCQAEEKRFFPRYVARWKWALGAACLTFVLLAGYWIAQRPGGSESVIPSLTEEQFQINYIRVEEKPAGAYVYQPQDSEIIFVWAERSL
jgi:hypothetical protein